MKKRMRDFRYSNILFSIMEVIGWGLFVSMFLFFTFFDENVGIIFFSFWLTDLIVLGVLFLSVWAHGYSFNRDKIVEYSNFKRINRSYKEIQSVVISNAYVGGRYGSISPINVRNRKRKKVIYPWVTLIYSKETDSVFTKPINQKLNSFKVQKEWLKGKDFLGFVFNKNFFEILLKEYDGKIYVARSIYINFEIEIAENLMYKKVKDKNIIFIEDVSIK